jgi:hypothetical protein
MKSLMKWIQRRRARELPNKCQACGLRVEYLATDFETERIVLSVAELERFGLATYPRRNIVAVIGGPGPNYTSFCAVANIRCWQKNNKFCPDWQLKLPGGTLSDYLSIHHSRASSRVASRIGWFALVVGIVGVITSVLVALP